jgi:hypothetical protein
VINENFEVNLISVYPIEKARFFQKKNHFFGKVEVGGVTYTAFPQQLYTLSA